MEVKNEKKVLWLSFLGVLTFIAVVVGATYAYFQAQGGGSANTNVNVQTATTDNLSFQVGESIRLTANQEDFGSGAGNKSGSTTASATLTANNATNNATRNYYVYLDITSNNFEYTTVDEQAELLLKVTAPDGTEVTTLGSLERKTSGSGANQVTGFDITTQTGLITIADNYEITSTGTETQEWQIEVIFANLDSDQNANTGKSFSATLMIQEEAYEYTLADVCPDGGNLASCIADLNTLTGDGTDSIYYHDADLANGAGDNSYRYSGANPNNYVCFGSTESPCPEENLYRIIGAFDDDNDTNYQIKLIKSDYTTSVMLGTDGRDYYGTYNWGTSYYKGSMDASTIAAYRWNYDTSVSTYGSNNWTTSEFNTINLNTNYWNYLGTTWQNLIAETTWHLGGMTSERNTAKEFYDGERGNVGYGSNPTTYSDEIGLMYPSDYGYAASPDAWTTDLYYYSNSTIRSKNWMYMGLYEWTISPYSSSRYSVFIVDGNGNLNYNSVSSGYAARPVFYLKSNVQLEGGSGTSSDPYRLAV